MNTVQVIVLLFAFMAIGFFYLLNGYIKIIKKHNCAVEYLDKFVVFNKSLHTDFDGETYYWLTNRVSKIQSHLGFFGVMGYQPPHLNYIDRNYQIIINTLPEMRNMTAYPSMINACEDALIRYIGYLDDGIEIYMNQLKNPFK